MYIELDRRRKKEKNTSIKLESELVRKAQRLNDELAKGLGFNSLSELDKHTKDTEESSKLLMAHCRRIKKIATFVQKGKVSFPERLYSKIRGRD